MPRQPNVIIVLTDDLGWGDLGCYGHPIIQTPHLDAFAQQGMLLTDCHAASAVCSPSRAAILTGRTPQRNGMYTVRIHNAADIPYLRTSERTLPGILKEHGYATCHVGKWHLGLLKPDCNEPQPQDHGYDHWFATESAAKPNHLNPTNFIRNGEPVGQVHGNSAGIIVDEAIEWLDAGRAADQPFFLSVCTHEPHTPIGTEPELVALYDEELPQKKRDYYGNVTQIDRAFGTLMAALEERNLTGDTLVIFTSDNGPAWDAEFTQLGSTGGHRGGKAWMYEGGLRVPGLMRLPGTIAAGTVSHATINGTDYFPTILALAGIAQPDDRIIDGQSLLPVFANGRLPAREQALYWRYDGCDNDLKVCYREGDYVLLADAVLDRCEMYDLSRDWQQRHSLVYDEYDHFAEMKKRLVAIHHAVQNDGPDWWRECPDPLVGWKQQNPIGIRRFLVGEQREPAKKPYPAERLPTGA